jgi:polysaccharide biosynthesis transport protein
MHQLPEPRNNNGELLPAPTARQARVAFPASYADSSYANAANPNSHAASGTFLEYWRILRRRKGILIFASSLGAIIGFVVTLPQTPIYQAHSSLEIVALNQNFLNFKESNPLNESASSVDTTDIQTQIKILQSDALIDRVTAKLESSDSTPEPKVTRLAAWRKLLSLPDPELTNPREQSISYARKHYRVHNSPQTRIIEVTVDSENPRLAASFANTLTGEFIDQNLEARWQTTEHTSNWLGRQLDDMRIRLETSEDRLQTYAREAGLLFTGQQQSNNVSEEKLLQLQQALSAAQTERISKQSRWEMANSSPAEALPDVLNDATLRDYRAKLTELKRQIVELRTTYTDQSPKVRKVQVQVATLETALSTERADILKRIKNEYDEALRRESLLTADYAAQRVTVTGESEKAVQYDVMKHEVESNRQLYDSMLQQLKQATLASALRASNIRVVDPAKAPRSPYKPDIPLSTGIGFLGGVFLGAAFAILQERADRSIQSPGETQFILDLPELGVVPAEQAGVRVRLRHSLGSFASAHPSIASPENNLANFGRHVGLTTWRRKPSGLAESFRATLVSILFSDENGSRPCIMVITSANPAEGKSTVVSNLGIAVAEANQRVLLIDADLRKPRLHDVFQLKNDNGLSDLLCSKGSLSDALKSAIQQTDIPDLCVITSGSKSAAATNLLHSNRVPALLQELRAEFETIFIDTPPMLQIPDARVLGRMVDRVILVVRAGKTTRDSALAARKRFAQDGTQVLGTILNDWNPRRSPNGYYGYGNGYYYGYNRYYAPKKSED